MRSDRAEPFYGVPAAKLYPLTVDQMRAGLPGPTGALELDGVSHWVQHEAADLVSEQLVTFLHAANPA